MKKIANSLIKLLTGGGIVLIFSTITLLNMNRAMAQYTCQTATFIQVTDSCELTTYYQSGYDDRWFTFSPETPGVGFEIEWDYSPRWAYIPYDTLYIYTGSCDSLVEYAILSPIPSSGENYFNGDGDVFFRFTRDNSTPADIEFDLCVYGIFECWPYALFTLYPEVICLGENTELKDYSEICNSDDKFAIINISPPVDVFDSTLAVFLGNFGTFTTIIHPFTYYLVPTVCGWHTVTLEWNFFIDNYWTNVFYTDSFYVYCEPNHPFNIIADVDQGIINCNNNFCNISCDANTLFLIDTSLFCQNLTYYGNSVNDFSTSYMIDNQLCNDTLGLNIDSWFSGCNDTLHIWAVRDQVCSFDTIYFAFTILPPEVNFFADTVCLGSPTYFSPTLDPDCVESWLWNFGDGYILTSSSPLQAVSHIYNSSGTYQASLTVYYHSGLCSVVVSHPVIVSEVEKPEFSVPWEWACADEIVFTIENYDPSLHYFYTIDDPFAPFETLPVTGASSPLPQVEIPWPGMTGGIIYIHVLDDNGCYAYDSLVVFNCCFDASSGEFYYNHTFSGNQTMTGQSFYLNGTIDFAPLSNYQFIDCNFYFSPNSKMIIPDFANVSIDKSGVLQACEPLMWDGIYVYGSGSLTISGGSPSNVLIQDAKHAVVSTDGGQFLIRKTTFDINYNHLAVFNYPCENHTGEIYASELICTGAILPQYPPVVASKTRFAIEVGTIKNLTIGRIGNNNTNVIENCDIGIYSRNSFINVRNNSFKNINSQLISPGMPNHPRGFGIYSFALPMGLPLCNGIGIMYDRGISTFIQMQTANTFVNCEKGIASYDNPLVNIARNTFSFDNNTFGQTAIEMSAWIYGQQTNKIITGNTISSYRYGIKTSNTSNVNINGNIISKLRLPFPFGANIAAGIEINGGSNIIIHGNTVDNSYMQPTNRYEGIKISQATTSVTSCNVLKSLGIDIHYAGYCYPTQIKKNEMHNSITGFALSNDGRTGKQGDIEQPWDNTWTGTFINHLYTFDFTLGDLDFNHWYLVQPGTPHWTNLKHPLPFNSNEDISSEKITPISTPGRLQMQCAIPIISSQFSQQPLMEDIALDQAANLQHPSYRRWFSRDGLMKTIDANPDLLQNPVLNNFRLLQNQESTGKLELIIDTVAHGYHTEGLLLNASILPESSPDSLSKTINSILLNINYSESPFFYECLDSLTYVQFIEFAQLCPFEYGNSVYLSRAMLSMMGDTTEYRNDCELMNDPIEGKSSQVGSTETIVMVYPNPTNGQITLETNATLPETLYLYNFMGQLLDKFVITTNFTVIDLSKFNQQILFYRFCEKAGIINVIK